MCNRTFMLHEYNMCFIFNITIYGHSRILSRITQTKDFLLTITDYFLEFLKAHLRIFHLLDIYGYKSRFFSMHFDWQTPSRSSGCDVTCKDKGDKIDRQPTLIFLTPVSSFFLSTIRLKHYRHSFNYYSFILFIHLIFHIFLFSSSETDWYCSHILFCNRIIHCEKRCRRDLLYTSIQIRRPTGQIGIRACDPMTQSQTSCMRCD